MNNPHFIIGVCAILIGVGGMMMGVKMIRSKKRTSLNRITPTGRPATIVGILLIVFGVFIIVGYFLLGQQLLEHRSDNIESDEYRRIDLSDE